MEVLLHTPHIWKRGDINRFESCKPRFKDMAERKRNHTVFYPINSVKGDGGGVVESLINIAWSDNL